MRREPEAESRELFSLSTFQDLTLLILNQLIANSRFFRKTNYIGRFILLGFPQI